MIISLRFHLHFTKRDVFTTVTSIKVMFYLPTSAGGHQIAAATFIYYVLI